MKTVIRDNFLEQMSNILKIFINYIVTYHSYQKEKKIEKVKKLVCTVQDKEKYVVHIRALKQAPNYELILEKVHRVIQFNQKAWLKPYIDMNTKLRINE